MKEKTRYRPMSELEYCSLRPGDKVRHKDGNLETIVGNVKVHKIKPDGTKSWVDGISYSAEDGTCYVREKSDFKKSFYLDKAEGKMLCISSCDCRQRCGKFEQTILTRAQKFINLSGEGLVDKLSSSRIACNLEALNGALMQYRDMNLGECFSRNKISGSPDVIRSTDLFQEVFFLYYNKPNGERLQFILTSFTTSSGHLLEDYENMRGWYIITEEPSLGTIINHELCRAIVKYIGNNKTK